MGFHLDVFSTKVEYPNLITREDTLMEPSFVITNLRKLKAIITLAFLCAVIPWT